MALITNTSPTREGGEPATIQLTAPWPFYRCLAKGRTFDHILLPCHPLTMYPPFQTVHKHADVHVHCARLHASALALYKATLFK